MYREVQETKTILAIFWPQVAHENAILLLSEIVRKLQKWR